MFRYGVSVEPTLDIFAPPVSDADRRVLEKHLMSYSYNAIQVSTSIYWYLLWLEPEPNFQPLKSTGILIKLIDNALLFELQFCKLLTASWTLFILLHKIRYPPFLFNNCYYTDFLFSSNLVVCVTGTQFWCGRSQIPDSVPGGGWPTVNSGRSCCANQIRYIWLTTLRYVNIDQ